MNVRVEEKVSVSSLSASLASSCVCERTLRDVLLERERESRSDAALTGVCVCDETWGHAELSWSVSVLLSPSL